MRCAPGQLTGLTTLTILDRVKAKEIGTLETKTRLSELLAEVQRGQSFFITRHGKREAVVLSFAEWERLSQVPSFGRLLMSAPLTPDDLPVRDEAPLRDAGF